MFHRVIHENWTTIISFVFTAGIFLFVSIPLD